MSGDTLPAVALLYLIIYIGRAFVIGLHELAIRIDQSDAEVVAAILFMIMLFVFADYMTREGEVKNGRPM